jgi:hypothetical protein
MLSSSELIAIVLVFIVAAFVSCACCLLAKRFLPLKPHTIITLTEQQQHTPFTHITYRRRIRPTTQTVLQPVVLTPDTLPTYEYVIQQQPPSYEDAILPKTNETISHSQA